MSSAYTALIASGEMTALKDYAGLCVRYFTGNRTFDEPVPENLKPDSFYDEQIKRAGEEWVYLSRMTAEEIARETRKYNEREAEAYQERLAEVEEKLARYEAMLEKVKRWEPPSEYRDLRNFMIEQLATSIRDDSKNIAPPKRLTPDEWLMLRRGELSEDYEYWREAKAREEELIWKRSHWLRRLRESLENAEATATKAAA